MTSTVALIVTITFSIVLLRIDSKRLPASSYALWLPTVWLLINGSRPIALWFDVGAAFITPESYAEGNPLDRNILIGMIVMAFLILVRRKIPWAKVIQENWWLVLLLCYCGVSIVWSDYPFVSLKRWIRGIGGTIILVVVLTEANWSEAIRRVLRRCAYILIPMSIVLYKYYSYLGRAYHRYTGELAITGVTTNKNTLGLICFALGLLILWEITLVWKTRKSGIDKTYLSAQIVVFVMVVWLLATIDSFTSSISFGFGSMVMLATAFGSTGSRTRRAWVCFGTALCLAIGVTLGGPYIASMGDELRGKDTFGGRISFWPELVNLMGGSEWIGVGYDSYWLGDRLGILWTRYWWWPTEAHNGYVEIYLELGLIGLFFLAGVILSGWRKVRARLLSWPEIGPLLAGLFCAILAYNTQETAFKLSHFLWAVFFLTIAGSDGLAKEADTTQEKGTPG